MKMLFSFSGHTYFCTLIGHDNKQTFPLIAMVEIYLMLFDKKVLIWRKVYVWKVCSKPITAELHHWCKAIQQTILQFIINPIHRCRENEIPGRLYGSTCHPKCHIVHYSTPASMQCSFHQGPLKISKLAWVFILLSKLLMHIVMT